MQITQFKTKCISLIISCVSMTSFTGVAVEHSAYNKAIKVSAQPTTELNHQVNINNNTPEEFTFTEAELAQILAPIALYPDTLLSHILISATYPIEVIDANRWLTKNQHLSIASRAENAENMDWDPSIKALLPFPNILEKLSTDLHWMRSLGDAFLESEENVLANIQSLRAQADQAGNLNQMDNVKIIRKSQTIIIEPDEPEIIYVPYYDSRSIYGNWHWRHYPPVFWHRPAHYARHRGPYFWYSPVRLTVGLFFGNVHWHNRHVVVNYHKSRYYKRHSKKRISTSVQAQRWQHKPHRRKGVAYKNTHVKKRYSNHKNANSIREIKHHNLNAKLRAKKFKKRDVQIKKMNRTKVHQYSDDKYRHVKTINRKVAKQEKHRQSKRIKKQTFTERKTKKVKSERIRTAKVAKTRHSNTHKSKHSKSMKNRSNNNHKSQH